jgi:hypothetical protein
MEATFQTIRKITAKNVWACLVLMSIYADGLAEIMCE